MERVLHRIGATTLCYCFLTSHSRFFPRGAGSSTANDQIGNNKLNQTINNFREKPISFLWAQANDHPEIEEQFSLQSGFPAVLLISIFE
jgi:hypothetical protein